jgi:hypothetical protein
MRTNKSWYERQIIKNKEKESKERKGKSLTIYSVFDIGLALENQLQDLQIQDLQLQDLQIQDLVDVFGKTGVTTLENGELECKLLSCLRWTDDFFWLTTVYVEEHYRSFFTMTHRCHSDQYIARPGHGGHGHGQLPAAGWASLPPWPRPMSTPRTAFRPRPPSSEACSAGGTMKGLRHLDVRFRIVMVEIGLGWENRNKN